MLLRDSEHLGELCLCHRLALPDGPQELGKSQRATAELFEESQGIRATALGCNPPDYSAPVFQFLV
jgi:hypothetical protein